MQRSVAATPIAPFHSKVTVWYQVVHNCILSS